MMKPTLLLLLALGLFSCSQTTKEYDKEFFRSRPFDGAKGNVESMQIESDFEYDTDTPKERTSLYQKMNIYYNKEGGADSLLWIEYKDNDSIFSMNRYYDVHDGLPYKALEERRKGNRHRKIETSYQKVDKEHITIVRKDLTDPTVKIPKGSIEFDFKNQTSHYISTRDFGMYEDMEETYIKTYENRREVKNKNKRGDEAFTTVLTDYDANGLAISRTLNFKVLRFFNKKTVTPITYSDMDEKGNYRESRSVFDNGNFRFTSVMKYRYTYRN